MNIRSRRFTFGIVASSLVALLAVVFFAGSTLAADEPLTSEQKQRIQANCQSIKSTLNQLHVSDALLRVNRGQFYESLAGKLMDRFNGRLAANDIDAKSMVAITGSYRTALNTFRTDYQVYEHQLADALAIDCTKEAQAFHDSVEEARTKRSKVHQDVLRLNEYISDYKLAVNTFAESYGEVSTGDAE